MKQQLKYKIETIRFDTYKGNIVTLIQFNSNSESQFEILTASEIIDKITVVSSDYKGIVLLDLPLKIDCNNLNTLVTSLKKAGYNIIIKSELQLNLLKYVFNAKLHAEFRINENMKVNVPIENFYNLSDKITFSFPIRNQTDFNLIIYFIKMIRPHTKAKVNLYTNCLVFSYNDLCNVALQVPNILQLDITIDKYSY